MKHFKNFTYKFLVVSMSILTGSAALADIGYTSANVNVRYGPNGSILRVIPKGTKVKLLKNKAGFSRVSFSNGRIGWISQEYITSTKPNGTGTQASHCTNCDTNNKKSNTENSAKQISAAIGSSKAACISNLAINGLKNVIKEQYGNRNYSTANCALAVRRGLNRSGIWTGGGLGHGADFQTSLPRLGFINLQKNGKYTPENAPNGSILVYGRSTKFGCRGKGATFGHVEIKENNGSFLYDGKLRRSIQKAVSVKCRPLVGVFIMGDTCKTCTKSVKQRCGV